MKSSFVLSSLFLGVVAPIAIAQSFTPTGDLATPRACHSATLLHNGKVLIVGMGINGELYDPATGTFADTGPYADPSPGLVETATLLPDGRVLITGCSGFCAAGVTQLYDSGTNTFSATGPMKGWYN